MIINDVRLDIDFTDADFIEKIEIGSKKVYEETEKVKSMNFTTLSEGIRRECKILKDFLDYVLGEGTSEKLFGKKDSINLCWKAFEDIINEKEKQFNKINEFVTKYGPERLK